MDVEQHGTAGVGVVGDVHAALGHLPDKPGELVKVAKIIADANGNVIKLDHNQFVSINRKATVELRITIEAFGHEHKEQIVSELEKNGLRPRLVKVNI
jgi:threonine dehydratase